MGIWINVVRAATVLNVLVLLALSVVWVRNYRRFHSKHTLGLLVFGLLLLAENVTAFWVFGLDPVLSVWFADPENMPGRPGTAMMALRVLETVALAFLAWVTWD